MKYHSHNIPLLAVMIGITLLMSVQTFPVWAGHKKDRHRAIRKIERVHHRKIHRHKRHHDYHYSCRRGLFFRISALGNIAITAPFGEIVFGLPVGYRHIVCGRYDYYYYDGMFYRRHPDGYVVVRAPRVRFIPAGAKRVVVNEEIYFVHNGIWYCRRNGEYELCEPQVSPASNNQEEPQVTIIMIENSNGSRTPVELKPLGANQWKGPRGEIYDGLPAEERLSEAYGF